MAKDFDYSKNPLRQNPNLLGSKNQRIKKDPIYQQRDFEVTRRAGLSSSSPPKKTIAVPKPKPKTMAAPKTLPKSKPQRTKMGNKIEWVFR